VNWKSELQVLDLERDQRLEMTCRLCGHVHYLTPALIMSSPERQFLYLDEVERDSVCKARKCYGKVRMAILRKGEASGFVGGMA
jgi:hypothetical protein